MMKVCQNIGMFVRICTYLLPILAWHVDLLVPCVGYGQRRVLSGPKKRFGRLASKQVSEQDRIPKQCIDEHRARMGSDCSSSGTTENLLPEFLLHISPPSRPSTTPTRYIYFHLKLCRLSLPSTHKILPQS